MSKRNIKLVARAIADALPLAGQQYGVTTHIQSPARRARNLIENGYVREPTSFCDGALVQIGMEPRNYDDPDDCAVPLNYYEGDGDGADAISDLLTPELTGERYGWYVEFINAGVAAVYKG